MKHLKKLNFINFGNSLLINTNQKYNFYKFHASVILFLKPSDNIDVLDYKIYKKNEQIKEIIKILYQNKFNVFEDIFKKVVMIQKLKNNITKTYFEKKILNKTYVTTILDRLKKILKK